MPDFKIFKKAVQKQFLHMEQTGELFRVDLDKDAMWDLYLASFPEGTNPMFREKTEYDCNCCKQFIRAIGDVVIISGGQLYSIWDIDVDGTFKVVSNALSEFVKSHKVGNVFRHYEKKVGTDFNLQHDDHSIRWEHFYIQIPKGKYVMKETDIATKLGEFRTSKEMYMRACEEITQESIDTVIELIEQNSLYRGEEHLASIQKFAELKRPYVNQKSPEAKDLFAWSMAATHNMALRFRNTVIGTLVVDISNDVPLDEAVRMFEAKVAPANYKRPTAVVTKGMILKAQAKVEELGIMDSLARRYATTEDLTINNVLFANRDAKTVMAKGDVFSDMMSGAPKRKANLDKVEEVSIAKFMSDILPTATKLEVMFENNQTQNLLSLIAPTHLSSTNILKWGNNFTWSYNGEVTDSMKQNVKSAGGDVEGVLRFSIQWNDEGNNNIDFDAHCQEPCGNRIYYRSKHNSLTSGKLDVDIISPGGKVAVENITWSDEGKMSKGKYVFSVKNYSSSRSNGGFTAEIEYNGEVHSFTYDKNLNGDEIIEVAVGKLGSGKFEIQKSIPSSTSSKTAWGLTTNEFHNVSMVMNSPNHWDGEETGNKHVFFMLEGCMNEGTPRGFFNEFLSDELTEHRKVFEVLGSKMRVEPSEHQLSGLGFSSTKRSHVIVKVTGSFTRIVKVLF